MYALEPATNGKVLLKTSVGDIDIELWPKESPKACRNFIQLCLEGYYDNTIFHRIVKDFIVQGGDPTGTGFGGESIYGQPFADEFHSRLKYRHRGMVGMANTGRDQNRSQFFITLGPAGELEGKNTPFGKVTGNTIFNVLKLGEQEVNEEDRPLYPPRILAAEVLSNPFDDIVPRDLYALGIKRKPGEEDQSAKPAVDRPQIRKKRNVALLSFGEEEGAQEPAPQFKPRMKSSHVADEPGSAADAEAGPNRGTKAAGGAKSDTVTTSSSSRSSSSTNQDDDEEETKRSAKDRRPSERKRRRTEGRSDEEAGEEDQEETTVVKKRDESAKRKRRSDDGDAENDDSKKPATSSAYDEVMGRREREKEERKKEFNELKKSLLSFKKQSDKPAGEDDDKKKKGESTLDPLEQMRLKYKDKAKKRTGDRQKQTLEALKKFQSSLKQPDKEWKQHVLKFEKIGGQMEKEEELYSVFDPLAGKDQRSKPSWHKQRLQRKDANPEKW